MENQKIAILGSNGFIGKNLLKTFHKAVGISLRDPDWQSKLAGCKVIVNLIGKAHDHEGVAERDDYYYANLTIAQLIFKEFTKSSAEILIHISSIAAVEELESSRLLAEDEMCRPQSWYGRSKREAEEWLLTQKLPPGKKLIILRPPMVHGPGDKGNLRILYNLISKGIPYPLSSFKNRRSFISVQNFSYFLEQICKSYEKLESGIYHIADDQPISTEEIIDVIKQVTGKKVLNVHLPKLLILGIAKFGDVFPIPLNSKRLKKMTSDLLVSNSKIKALLGIQRMPITAKQGLEATIQSLRD